MLHLKTRLLFQPAAAGEGIAADNEGQVNNAPAGQADPLQQENNQAANNAGHNEEGLCVHVLVIKKWVYESTRTSWGKL